MRTLNQTQDGTTMTVPFYNFKFASTERIQPIGSLTAARALVGMVMQRLFDADNGEPYYDIVWRSAADNAWVSQVCERAHWIDERYEKSPV